MSVTLSKSLKGKKKFRITISVMGEKRDVYRGLVGKPEGKGPLGRPRSRWEDNIKIDLEEV
jgi:hypothetical protein